MDIDITLVLCLSDAEQLLKACQVVQRQRDHMRHNHASQKPLDRISDIIAALEIAVTDAKRCPEKIAGYLSQGSGV